MIKKFEILFEKGLFTCRWLMAPFYIGLVSALLILLYNFGLELIHSFSNITKFAANDAILSVLSLIDLSLVGNLLLIVIFSGYENFVSKIDIGEHEDKPGWMGAVDFSTLKLKLVASIIAISGIHLLKGFMNINNYPTENIKWMIIIHVVFVLSGVMLATMDFIASKTRKLKK
ncbi:membrane protein (plasmid) [Rickettsiales bacterium Ac37b]|nr:membrane protein [Rickettsiales bacterium Ac37b]